MAFLNMACPILMVLSGLMLAAQAESQPATPAPTIVGAEQLKAVHAALEGQWVCDIGPTRCRLTLDKDGQFTMGDESGSYDVAGSTLTLHTTEGQVAYQFTLDGKELTLSGGDLAGRMKFTRISHFGESGKRWTDWSWPALKTKARRIGTILLAVVISLTAVRLVRTGMHVIIYSERGPLKFIYRRHKKRTMTVYSLVLNISKYVIYLLAIGFVLTELGVNYTMYFASLSVVGLAIGFGSQGLVQDMVTGFFIVFEEQFNVGDMVEIPPHTGIVEELGLRMTRLRNYFGQRVVIPNRNIAVVGNYIRGSQQVYLDVALSPEIDAGKISELLERHAREIAGQFQDIVLSAPKSQGEIALATGERFVRLHLAIWPQQQWVVEQEMVPRMRAALKAEGVEIPNDKIVVFYHPREDRSVPRHQRDKSKS